ncbi:MAG: general secretion pathway protein GspK [Gammaproteobacteria bacterium]|nr:MAG: general secretion pathway protein GspK [Gammaproteobacteria bacterium]
MMARKIALCSIPAAGFALVSVLWLIVLLSVIAMGLSYTSRQSTQAMISLVGGTQARYLAEGGVQLVIMNLLSRDATQRLLADGETIDVELPGGHVEVTVSDENGKVDINAAREPLLARLFYSLDVEQEIADALADAIADFRDEDDLTRLNGAEDTDYLAAGRLEGAKDAPFTSVEELQQVLGMTPEIYRAVLPYVTIYSRHQGINPEVASLQVLTAVSDDSPMTLESYIQQRRMNHRDNLPMPSPPVIDRQFLSRTRGVTYSLTAAGITESGQESGMSTTVRLRRGRNRMSIETIDWQPFIERNDREWAAAEAELVGGEEDEGAQK